MVFSSEFHEITGASPSSRLRGGTCRTSRSTRCAAENSTGGSQITHCPVMHFVTEKPPEYAIKTAISEVSKPRSPKSVKNKRPQMATTPYSTAENQTGIGYRRDETECFIHSNKNMASLGFKKQNQKTSITPVVNYSRFQHLLLHHFSGTKLSAILAFSYII